jgi:hypothetical protein
MPHWRGRETADIVYKDQNSSLTHLLIEKGYLASETWNCRSPQYFIEVKTTTDSCDTAFYCSQPQYDRMELMQLSGTSPSDEVYLIARVFQLGDSGMGLKLYVDPATLRRDKELRFRADKYLVTPI